MNHSCDKMNAPKTVEKHTESSNFHFCSDSRKDFVNRCECVLEISNGENIVLDAFFVFKPNLCLQPTKCN